MLLPEVNRWKRLLKAGRDTVSMSPFHFMKPQDVLTVPASSVFDSGDRDYVYLIKDGKAVKTEIAVEYRTASEVVVKDGITAGEKVIEKADEEGIYDGVKVKG